MLKIFCKKKWICASRRPTAGAGGERRPYRASGLRPPDPPRLPLPAAGPASRLPPPVPPRLRLPAPPPRPGAPPERRRARPPTGGGVAEISRRRVEICRRRGGEICSVRRRRAVAAGARDPLGGEGVERDLLGRGRGKWKVKEEGRSGLYDPGGGRRTGRP